MFGKEIWKEAMKCRLCIPPGTPRFVAMRIMGDQDKLGAKEHATYRSGVGTLLYLTKPMQCCKGIIQNIGQTCTKTLIRNVQNHKICTCNKMSWIKISTKLVTNMGICSTYSDSDYASDKETRRSVYGYFVYFCGVPIAWRSKRMRSVVQSTAEAEYIALSEVVKELKFITQLLETMKIQVEIPITVYVDNDRAVWLSNKQTTSERTKHVHIRTEFVKEYQEEGKILIKFVKSEDYDADISTKNSKCYIPKTSKEVSMG